MKRWFWAVLLLGCGSNQSYVDRSSAPSRTEPNAAPASAREAGKRWTPPPGTTWQWQLHGTIDTSLDVQVYDVDLFTTSKATIAQLHGAGRKVLCYFSAGSYEPYRPDSERIPQATRGKVMEGWEDERWLDVRSEGLRPVMKARLDLAVEKGCDGVEPDNVDGYTNKTGFPLTGADQLAFNKFLAAEAHARGLSIALKNDLDQAAKLVGDFDLALNEECFEHDECDKLKVFIRANKAVFNVEYGGTEIVSSVCPRARELKFDTLIKKKELDAWRLACR
jgi:hypothetical protein